MKRIMTKIDGNVMTFGLFDRLLRWTITRLDNYEEQRHNKLWDKAEFDCPFCGTPSAGGRTHACN